MFKKVIWNNFYIKKELVYKFYQYLIIKAELELKLITM
jgi:hypothetical protein